MCKVVEARLSVGSHLAESSRTMPLASRVVAVVIVLACALLIFWPEPPCGHNAYHRHIIHGKRTACLDGSPPVFYYRRGKPRDEHKLVISLQGGGWCKTSAGCALRSRTDLGSTRNAPACLPQSPRLLDASFPHNLKAWIFGRTAFNYEGGVGFLSDVGATTAWAGWSVARFVYCDGGSMAGTRHAADMSEGKPLYYRGHYNFLAQLDALLRLKPRPTEIVLTGCSSGGMAAALKCDLVAERVSPIPVRCVLDAAVFPSSEEFDTLAALMMPTASKNNSRSLPRRCVLAEADARSCLRAEVALKHTQTPTYVINDLFNWQHPQEHDFAAVDDRAATAADVLFTRTTHAALMPAWNASTPHGVFASRCHVHCQSSEGWLAARIDGVSLAESLRRWYFERAREKRVDVLVETRERAGGARAARAACHTPALTVSNFWPVEVRLRVLLVMVLVALLILFPYRCQAGADLINHEK